MVPDFSTEEYIETLCWFNRLYQEGLMDRSFPFLTAVQRQEYMGCLCVIGRDINDLPYDGKEEHKGEQGQDCADSRQQQGQVGQIPVAPGIAHELGQVGLFFQEVSLLFPYHF